MIIFSRHLPAVAVSKQAGKCSKDLLEIVFIGPGSITHTAGMLPSWAACMKAVAPPVLWPMRPAAYRLPSDPT